MFYDSWTSVVNIACKHGLKFAHDIPELVRTDSTSSGRCSMYCKQSTGGLSGGIIISGCESEAGRWMSAMFQFLPHFLQMRRPMHFSTSTSSRSLKFTANWISMLAPRAFACAAVLGKPSSTNPFSPFDFPSATLALTNCNQRINLADTLVRPRSSIYNVKFIMFKILEACKY